MKTLLLLAGAMLAAGGLSAQPAANTSSPADKLGWQVAMHAYTFKEFPIAEAIDKTAALGLKHMSLSGSVNLDGQRKPALLTSPTRRWRPSGNALKTPASIWSISVSCNSPPT